MKPDRVRLPRAARIGGVSGRGEEIVRALSTRRVDYMTTGDYHMVMKRVGIAELKARLSEYVRDVRRGHGLVVMDRKTPVARLEPYEPAGESWGVRRPLRRWASLQAVPLPPPLRLESDVVDVLLEDRRGEG